MNKIDCQTAVLEFHDIYGVPVGDSPQDLSLDRLSLRLGLIKEEWEELLDACNSEVDHHGRLIVRSGNHNIVEMADALGDIVYVCFGMAIEMGIDLNAVFAEIQRANMSKLKDGKPFVNICTVAHCGNPQQPCSDPRHLIDDKLPQGKVMKGPDYSPPDIKAVLDRQSGLND